MAAEDRASKQIRAAYERQEAELVRSLAQTPHGLALLQKEPTTCEMREILATDIASEPAPASQEHAC